MVDVYVFWQGETVDADGKPTGDMFQGEKIMRAVVAEYPSITASGAVALDPELEDLHEAIMGAYNAAEIEAWQPAESFNFMNPPPDWTEPEE
jgi:hypothetical protein